MKFPKTLQAALDQAEGILKERAQIRALLQSSSQRLQTIEGQLKETLESLAVIEAEGALTGAPPNSSSPAFKKQQSLKNEADLLRARISGLETRLAASEHGLIEANDALTIARSDFVREQFEQFREQYNAAAKEFITVARHGAVLSEVLGSDLPGLARVEIPDLFRGGSSFRIAEHKHQNGAWVEIVPRDETSEAIANELGPVKQTASIIEREAAAIRQRRVEEERVRREAEWEKRPAFSSATLPPSTHSIKVAEEQEAALKKAIETRTEIESATMFPDNPERRYGATAAHLYPSGTGPSNS